MKEIYFLIDGLIPANLNTCLDGCKVCFSYDSTNNAIKEGITKIATYSMIHLSFSLLDEGYDIYLVNNGNIVKITPHMSEIDKDLKKSHNVRRLFLAGVFDNLVKHKTNG